jgi:hypothetical protein
VTSVVPGSIDHQLQNCVSTVVQLSFGHQSLGTISKHPSDAQAPIVFDARYQFGKTIQPLVSTQSQGLFRTISGTSSIKSTVADWPASNHRIARHRLPNLITPRRFHDGESIEWREHASITPFSLARSAARPPTTLHMSREKRHGTTIAHESTTRKLRKPTITRTLLS